jgi:hypothetical protein
MVYYLKIDDLKVTIQKVALETDEGQKVRQEILSKDQDLRNEFDSHFNSFV